MAEDINEEMEKLCTKSVEIFMEKVRKMIPRVKLRDYTMQYFGCVPMTYLGSQAECIHGLNSDTDIMYECQSVKVVQKPEETNGLDALPYGYDAVVILDSSETHEGYTKLKLFDIKRKNAFSEIDVSTLCVDGFLSIGLVSTFWKDRLARRDLFPSHGMQTGLHQHGPCITFKYSGMENRLDTDIDSVFTLPCDWPDQAREWFTRQRNNNWPSQELQQKIKTIGCHLVPIGHTLSPHRDIEWRISFNKPERELVWSFNGTQYACVDFMKIFFHVKISPNFPDLFPSYFIKTVMFWMVEDSEPDLWKPENLCRCLEELLGRIIICVGRKEIRHYFIPSNNIIDTKSSDSLDALLSELIQFQKMGCEKWKPIMKARIDERDENDIYFYHVKINALSTVRHYIINLLSTSNNEEFIMYLAHINQTIKQAMRQTLSNDIWEIFQVDIETIQRLHEHLQREKSSDDTEMKPNYKQDSYNKSETYAQLTHWLEGERRVCFRSGRLELATWYLYLGRYVDAREVVDEFLSNYDDTMVYYTFHNRDKKPKDKDYDIKFPRLSFQETLRKYILFDVVFLPVLKELYPKTIQTVLENTGSVLFISPLFYSSLVKFHSFKDEGSTEAATEIARQLLVSTKDNQNETILKLALTCNAMVK